MRAAQRIPLDFIATGLYFGKIPFAPGTWGTLPGIALLWLMADFPLWSKLLIAGLLFFGGVLVCHRAQELYGRKDPSCVVIDEIAGVFFAGMWFAVSWPMLLAVFVLFRFFDILKPWPIRRLETLRDGWGVMADDMAAGAAAALVLVAVSLLL